MLHGTFEERTTELFKKASTDQEWVMTLLLTISKKLRARTELEHTDPDHLSPISVGNPFKALRKLFDMNDVPIVWKRVYATFPERMSYSNTRGYTRKEIQKMLDYARGSIDRAIILVAASSGIRRGAFDGLKWENVTPVYKVDNKIVLDITESEVKSAEIVCAILVIYEGSNQEYSAFITPEAYQSILDYKASWIREVGREPRPTDPLFKQEGDMIRPLKHWGIAERILNILELSGIRKPLPKGRKLHDVPWMNGFRRFFNKSNKETISRDSPLAALIKKEYMMNHVGLVKLDRNYFKTNVTDLIEEYLNAVPNLTISDEERLRLENQQKQE